MRFVSSVVFAAAIAASALAHAAAPGSPWLGVVLDPDDSGGARIVEVQPGSPAAKARIGVDEVLVAVGGQKTPSVEAAVTAIRAHKIGEHLKLRLRPKTGAEHTVDVVLEAKASEELDDGLAPDFVPDIVGGGPKFASMKALRGRVVVLDFFATWCGPCVAEMPHIRKLADEYAARGVTFVSISPEDRPVVERAVHRFGLSHPVVADPDNKIFRKYRVRALPTVIVVDAKGEIRALGIDEPSDLDRMLEQLAKPAAKK